MQNEAGIAEETQTTERQLWREHSRELRGDACKDRAKLEIGPKITTFETLSE